MAKDGIAGLADTVIFDFQAIIFRASVASECQFFCVTAEFNRADEIVQ
jgi:hypothetical protein